MELTRINKKIKGLRKLDKLGHLAPTEKELLTKLQYVVVQKVKSEHIEQIVKALYHQTHVLREDADTQDDIVQLWIAEMKNNIREIYNLID